LPTAPLLFNKAMNSAESNVILLHYFCSWRFHT
jgi:hypothetical protein